MADVLNKEGIESEIIQTGGTPVRDCIGCDNCAKTGKCVFDDDLVNEIIKKAKTADGFVFGSPVYFAHPSAQIQALLDRVFYARGAAFEHKPGAVVTSARRAGTTASLDAIGKYFGIRQMPVVSSTYWNMVHGRTPEEVCQDKEGLQTMRNLGRNMAWLLKCIETGKDKGMMAPETEMTEWTNFIR